MLCGFIRRAPPDHHLRNVIGPTLKRGTPCTGKSGGLCGGKFKRFSNRPRAREIIISTSGPTDSVEIALGASLEEWPVSLVLRPPLQFGLAGHSLRPELTVRGRVLDNHVPRVISR